MVAKGPAAPVACGSVVPRPRPTYDGGFRDAGWVTMTTDPSASPDAARPGPRSRGIYLLPNLFTTAVLFSGFYAVVAATDGNFDRAGIAIFVAMVCDGLDGRIARWTNTQSEFGKEYDSLSDMVSFGLAPALVMYEWALSGLGKLGWLAAFLYAATAALRLARFNVQSGGDSRYFTGLPSPSAAASGSKTVGRGSSPSCCCLRRFPLEAFERKP